MLSQSITLQISQLGALASAVQPQYSAVGFVPSNCRTPVHLSAVHPPRSDAPHLSAVHPPRSDAPTSRVPLHSSMRYLLVDSDCPFRHSLSSKTSHALPRTLCWYSVQSAGVIETQGQFDAEERHECLCGMKYGGGRQANVRQRHSAGASCLSSFLSLSERKLDRCWEEQSDQGPSQLRAA